jgi:uncharacterized protein DUF222
MPVTRRAVETGEVSMSAVRSLVRVREVDPEAFARSEAQLVEAARIHSIADLQRVVAFWRRGLERERGMQGAEQLRARRALHASVSFLGMVRLDGDLDPETGDTLLTALRAVLDAESRSRSDDDDRTPAQRRADALGEICRHWLDRDDRPSVGGERPHLTVTLPAEALAGPPGDARVRATADRNGWEEVRGTPTAAAVGVAADAELDHVGSIDERPCGGWRATRP